MIVTMKSTANSTGRSLPVEGREAGDGVGGAAPVLAKALPQKRPRDRADLNYRWRVVELTVPPLRDPR